MLALIVGGRDGLDDSKSPLATLPLVLLVIEQVRVVIFLFAKEVIFLVGVEVPGCKGEITNVLIYLLLQISSSVSHSLCATL